MAGNGGNQDPTPNPAPNPAPAGGEPTPTPNGGGDPAPAPAIDYDKLASILDGRQKANEESVLKGYFKQHGLTGDEMAKAIEAFKAERDSKAPDVGGMERQIGDLRAQVLAAKLENAVTVAAVQAGVDAKAIPYLAKMADLSEASGEDGSVDPEKVAAAIQKVLDDIPGLKPTAAAQRGFQVGGNGGKGDNPPKADDAALRRAFGLK